MIRRTIQDFAQEFGIAAAWREPLILLPATVFLASVALLLEAFQ